MSHELKQYLANSLERLEKAREHILNSQGPTRDTEVYNLLVDLVKEQVEDENSHTTAR